MGKTTIFAGSTSSFLYPLHGCILQHPKMRGNYTPTKPLFVCFMGKMNEVSQFPTIKVWGAFPMFS